MKTLLEIIESLLGQPTAPFHEDAVALEIERLLSDCPNVAVAPDEFGNLIAIYARGERRTPWAFAAHMDHPGWVRDNAGEWQFLGGVREEYFKHDPARQAFSDNAAMWDLPSFELRDGRIYSRACDDLIGCATIIAMFYELERSQAEACCAGLFSRAEEVGFIGAIQLARSGLLPKDATVISLETSAERSPARMGEGVIIRVGDKTSIFEPSVTAVLQNVAEESKIRFQRCLMPGGTCEATAYALEGFRCGALCVTLGNYHNCGPGERIAPEFVSLPDVSEMARLCVALACHRGALCGAAKDLKERLEKNMTEHQPYFRKLAHLSPFPAGPSIAGFDAIPSQEPQPTA